MRKAISIPVFASAVIVAAALVGCDRREEVPRPKTASTEVSTNAPGGSADRPPTAPGAPPAAAVPAGDKTFAEKAASAGLAEVAITRLVIDKTASANVKKLAEHLYKEHTEANQELAKLATLKGLTLPAEPDQEKKREIDKVAALTSAELDRTVLGKLAQSHRESIELFEREANEGSDHELKAFATKTLPTLREHLKMVEGTKSAAAGEAPQTATKQ